MLIFLPIQNIAAVFSKKNSRIEIKISRKWIGVVRKINEGVVWKGSWGDGMGEMAFIQIYKLS